MAQATIRDVREYTGLAVTQKSDNDIRSAIEFASLDIMSNSRKAFTGVINKERVGISDGFQRRFNVLYFPILDKIEPSGGVATLDPTKVKVELLGQNDDTFALVPTADYEINGNEGLIFFKNGKVPTVGKEIYVSYKHSLFFLRKLEILKTAVILLNSMNVKDGRLERAENEFKEQYGKYLGSESAFFTIRRTEDRFPDF